MFLALLNALCLAGIGHQEVSPVLQEVLAVEEADSTFGRYRFVLALSEPLAPPSGTRSWPTVLLDGTPLHYPGIPRQGRIVFLYGGALPEGEVDLQLVPLGPTGGRSSVRLDAHARLRAARSTGRYEPPYVERSVGKRVDLHDAWARAGGVFAGRLLRADLADERETWNLTFERGTVLRHGAEPLDRPEILVPTPLAELELGARYLVFLAPEGDGTRGAHALVRLWQPGADPVLEHVRLMAAGALDPAGERRWLYESLASPVAEVRLAAAREILRLGGSFLPASPAEVERVAGWCSDEPASDVKAALQALTRGR